MFWWWFLMENVEIFRRNSPPELPRLVYVRPSLKSLVNQTYPNLTSKNCWFSILDKIQNAQRPVYTSTHECGGGCKELAICSLSVSVNRNTLKYWSQTCSWHHASCNTWVWCCWWKQKESKQKVLCTHHHTCECWRKRALTISHHNDPHTRMYKGKPVQN